MVLDLAELPNQVIQSDPGRIRQVLTNILSNAIKFTEHGEVAIAAKFEHIDEGSSVLLTFQIRDTGIGIPQDKLATLFDAFSQVDASTTRKYGGTGLGLSITKRLCQLLRGDIQVTSQVGVGSCFTVTSLVKAKTAQKHYALADLGLKLLLIDSNRSSRFAIRKQLELWGITVFDAFSGDDAIGVLKEHSSQSEGAFDIILFDKYLPCMQGEPLARSLRENTSHKLTKLVMMGRMNEQYTQAQTFKLGVDAYFHKPMTQLALLKTLGLANTALTHQLSSEQVEVEEVNDVSEIDDKTQWMDKTHVLLVEDNKVNQLVALKILNKLGVKTEVAENGQLAIERIKSCSVEKPFNVVLMDCQMPEMDGYQATQAIRLGEAGDDYANIPIIAMTANAMQGDKQKCLDVGMSDYITKPIVEAKIIEKLKEWSLK